MVNSKIFKGLLYSFISATAFASLAIFIKLGYSSGLDTKNMLFYRFVSASFFMFLFLLIKNPDSLKPSKTLIKKAIFMGGILYTAQSFSFFSSVSYVSPSVSELLLYIYPAFVSILAVLIFKEKIGLFKIGYIVVILSGFAFIFHDALHSQLRLLGVIFGLTAMIIYSIYLIVVQHFLKDENPLSLTFYTILFAAVAFSIIFHPKPKLPTMNQFAIIVSLGLISTVVAIAFLFASIDVIGSSLTSVFSSFEPIITILLSVVVLHMGMNNYQIAGAVLILTGVFLANIYHIRIEKNG
jgi:drug/metabolite transporter (DMT)-like permease